MDRSGLQRLIPVALVLIVIAIAVWGLISLGRMLFSGDDSQQSPQSPSATSGQDALKSTTADRSVRMTVRGSITANENFRSYTIAISPSSRTMTTYKGYMSEQIDTTQLDNNIPAYEQFVYALDRANLMKGTPSTGEANDLRGVCATGTVTMYEVLQNTNVIKMLWTSSCRGAAGSLEANSAQVSQLFQRQIPTYSQLRQKITL